MSQYRLPRRRFIGITAAAAGMMLLPLPFRAAPRAEPSARLRVWRGVALGADATLQIHHPDARSADRLIERCLAEVQRLERVFSLYRGDSAIATLNRQGFLEHPPTDFVQLLGRSEQFSRLTDGAFDATVQPLWRLYAAHFGRRHPDPRGPSDHARRAALACVGHSGVAVDASRVRFDRVGMGLTLNGIAQGYITDRVAELLLNCGLEHALVDMGEIRALGERPGGGPWEVGLEDPTAPDRIAQTLGIRNLAVSTSGGYGTRFDAAGRFNHIFDPANGMTSTRYLSVSVVGPRATDADALSTAFSVMPFERVQGIVRQLGITAYFTLPDGSRLCTPQHQPARR
jgi:thiamine biosynthesis lipoprotein